MDSFGKHTKARFHHVSIAALGRGLALLLLLHAAVFGIFDVLPEATYSRLGSAALEKRTLEQTRQHLGLDGNLPTRYGRSLRNLLCLDLGRSLESDYPVTKLLVSRFIVSIPIIVAALFVALAAMCLASYWYCAPTLSSLQRGLLMLTPTFLVPQFASASALAVGAVLIQTMGSASFSAPPVVIDALLVLSIAIMPAGVLFAAAARSAGELAHRRFVLTYQSIGLPWSRIRLLLQANILRQMLPLCNRVALAILLGTVFAEMSFDRLGIGAVLTDAIRSGDQPVAAGWMIAVAGPIILISQVVSTIGRKSLPS